MNNYFFQENGENRAWQTIYIPSGNDAVGPIHTRSFNLTGLNPLFYYEALIKSRNPFGWSEDSEIITFTTQETSCKFNQDIPHKIY